MRHACQGGKHTIYNSLARSLILINFRFRRAVSAARKAASVPSQPELERTGCEVAAKLDVCALHMASSAVVC